MAWKMCSSLTWRHLTGDYACHSAHEYAFAADAVGKHGSSSGYRGAASHFAEDIGERPPSFVVGDVVQAYTDSVALQQGTQSGHGAVVQVHVGEQQCTRLEQRRVGGCGCGQIYHDVAAKSLGAASYFHTAGGIVGIGVVYAVGGSAFHCNREAAGNQPGGTFRCERKTAGVVTAGGGQPYGGYVGCSGSAQRLFERYGSIHHGSVWGLLLSVSPDSAMKRRQLLSSSSTVSRNEESKNACAWL